MQFYRTVVQILLTLFVLVASWDSVLAADDQNRQEFSSEEIEYFEKHVRPVLATSCYSCHSANAEKLQAGLRLDSRASILAGGDSGPAIDLASVDDSLLLSAIRYEDFEMPPKGKLPDDQIAAIEKWLHMRAPWPSGDLVAPIEKSQFDWKGRKESHWSWLPVAHPTPPDVRSDWPNNPIDHFVFKKLQDVGLKPAADADRRSLIRRLYFDLIGLPPTVQQVREFLADDQPDAYHRLVNRLLESKHFGEKWARHWMDLVRYGESCGHEFDYPLPYAYRYRDYLIRVFNADVPYDQFVIEHIAGDLIENPRLHPTEKYNESIIGTGFWFLGEAVHAPTDVRADEADRIDNQLDVMCKTFLGLTVACARCHDHKFDPIPTSDYYALAGFLQSSRRQDALLDPHGRIRTTAKQLAAARFEANQVLQANVNRIDAESFRGLFRRDTPDSLDADSQEKRIRSAVTDASTDFIQHPVYLWRQMLDVEDNDFRAKWREAIGAVEQQQAEYEKSLKDTVLFEDFKADDYDEWFVTGDAFGSRPTQPRDWDVSRSNGFAEPFLADSRLLSNRLQGVLRSKTFELQHKQIHYLINSEDVQVRLIVDGYTMDTFNALLFGDITLENVKTGGEKKWVTQNRDLYHYVGHRAHIEIIDHGDGFAAVDEIRFSDSGPPKLPPHPVVLSIARNPRINSMADLLNAYQDIALQAVRGENDDALSLIDWFVRNGLVETSPAELGKIRKRMEDLESEIPDPVKVMALTDGTAEDERVHIRGNHLNLGEIAPRRILVAIGGENQKMTDAGSGRLDLARRMMSRQNPFAARVMANRIWHHLMGRGIVDSVDDFGAMGTEPTHPELLDWLASDFMDHDWSMKHLIRQIVLSRTYQTSTQANADQSDLIASIDPNNKLLHKARIRRLTAESLRDSILAVSGRLDDTMFGPSVKVHLTAFMEGRGRPRSGPLDGDGRRSVYQQILRNFLPPMMLAYDMPSPFNAMGRRSVSNVPSQALMLMNDPFVLAESKRWATRLLNDARFSTTEERIQFALESAIGRPPTERQLHVLIDFVARQADLYGANDDDIRIWTDLCHTIFNTKDFVYLN